jgi:hypothetical protein
LKRGREEEAEEEEEEEAEEEKNPKSTQINPPTFCQRTKNKNGKAEQFF